MSLGSSLPGGAAPSSGLPGRRAPPPFAPEEPPPSAPFESGYLSLKGPEEGEDEGRGFEPEQPRRPWEPDHPEAQMKVEFFRKLGYSPEEILSVLRKHGAGADTNTILGELVQHGAAAAAAAGDQEPGDPPAEPSPGTPRLPCGGAQPSPAEGNLRPIVIDGSNVAMSHGERGVFSCRGILLAVRWFLDRGHTDITVFVPSWRKEQPRPDCPIADQHILQELEKRKILVFTPSRRVGGKRVVCYDDRFIVKLACESDGIVVSNDTYRDLQAERAEWKKCIEERLLMYSFVNDKFMPPDDPLGRHGPSLENFLRKQPLPPEQKSQPCPYGKKCTYGLKCKYYHPERPPHHPQRAVADELRASARLSPTRGTTVTQEERMGWRQGGQGEFLAYVAPEGEKLALPKASAERLGPVPKAKPGEGAPPLAKAAGHLPSTPLDTQGSRRLPSDWHQPPPPPVALCMDSSLGYSSQEQLDSGLGSLEGQLMEMWPSHSGHAHRESLGRGGNQGMAYPGPPGLEAKSYRQYPAHQGYRKPASSSSSSGPGTSFLRYGQELPPGQATPHSFAGYGLPAGARLDPGQKYWSVPGPPREVPRATQPAYDSSSSSSSSSSSAAAATPCCPWLKGDRFAEERANVRVRLCGIFHPHLVDDVMGRFPQLLDPQKLAAEILAFKSQNPQA